jgi:hypothetical protein
MAQTRRANQAGSAALERLQDSIEAAETALKDLRGEVSRDSRDLLKDVGTTLKDARQNLRRSRRRITSDLERVERVLVKGKATGRPARKRTGAASRAGAGRTSKTARPKAAAKRGTKPVKRTASTVKRTAKPAKRG